MSQYNLTELCDEYYKSYLYAEHMTWGRIRRAGNDIEVEETFAELPRSERDCIIYAIRQVIVKIDPTATFTT